MSFSLSNDQPQGAPNVGRREAMQVRVVGGAVVNPDLGADPIGIPSAARTIDNLIKLGGQIAEPMIKREREANFVKGMARAAQGEAAKDIAEESPEWVRMFGDGDVVAGARAYEGAADGAILEGALIESLEEDADTPPDQYAGAVMKRVEALKTGDPVRDTALMAQALKAVPFAARRQAKEYAKRRTEEAFKARGAAIGAALDTFEKQASGDLAPGEAEAYTSSLLSSLEAPEGENPEWRDKQVGAQLSRLMTEGKFRAVQALKDVGAWDALPADQLDTLNRTLTVEATRRKWQGMTPELYDQYMDLVTNPPKDTTELQGRVDLINAQKRKVSGVPADLIDPDDMVRLLGARQKAEAAAATKASAADAKRLEAEQYDMRALGLIENADPGVISLELAGPDGTDLNKAFKRVLLPRWDAAEKLPPEQRIPQKLAYIQRFPPGKHPVLEAEIEYVKAQPGLSAKFAQHAELVRQLPATTAAAYWGKDSDLADLLFRFNAERDIAAQTGEKKSDQELYDIARAKQATSGFKTLDGDTGDAIADAVEQYRDINWSTKENVGEQFRGVELLTALATQSFTTMRQGPDDETSAAMAVSGAYSKGFRTTGNLGYLDMASVDKKQQPDWVQRLNPREDGKGYYGLGYRPQEAAAALEDAFAEKFGRNLSEEDMGVLIRLPDVGGKFRFMTYAPIIEQGVLTKTRAVYVTQDDVQRSLNRRKPQAAPADGPDALGAAISANPAP